MAALVVTLAVAGLRGADASQLKGGAELIPALNLSEGNKANGFFWPGLFILIACGAVSGFHSLCAGGTTCKQLTSEKATRQIGYNAMLLESFLAACVIAVFVVGAVKADYIRDVHPKALLDLQVESNAVLGFAMAVGNTAKLAFGVPIAVGALAGMVLLEGFLVTTLDTAVRLTRYLIEEVWRTVFARLDVFAEPVAMREQAAGGVEMPIGADGLPAAPSVADQPAAPSKPVATAGLLRGICLVLRQYWFNSGLAVALMLAFAMTGGQKALWAIFATSNQLLAALVLSIASLWLLRQKRSFWFALAPAAVMLVTTLTSLCLEIAKLVDNPGKNITLLIAEVVILGITTYLLVAGVAEAIRFVRTRGHATLPA
jgi:carbon starvation protein